MATPSATLQNLVSMEFKIGEIRKKMLDNQVSSFQTAVGELKTLVDALNTTALTKSQVAGSDLNTLL